MNSFEAYTAKPYLKPVSTFFPELDDALMMEIPLGGWCCCVASSPCGRYIAAGAGADIVVAKSSTGEVLWRLRGHSDAVTCVAFAAAGKKIMSGSEDKKIMIWEWEASESAVQVLEGHKGEVTGIAANSDGGRIYSCSTDGTVRIWDTATGTETDELGQGNRVNCVAVCGEKSDDCAWVEEWNIEGCGLRDERCAFRRYRGT